MPTRPFLNGCLVGLFPWFRAATYHQQLWIQTRHLEGWLTSVKFRCKVDVHWFNKLFDQVNKLFWPIRTSHILQPRKWLEICKCQRTTTSINALQSAWLATNSHSFTSRFLNFVETLCPYFEKYGFTYVLLANFRTNTVKYRRVGRSDTKYTSLYMCSSCLSSSSSWQVVHLSLLSLLLRIISFVFIDKC